MLQIYLPLSMDLKLCSNVPTVNFVDTWTFVTVFTSRYLSLIIWVLANGSKIICQPLGHLLGPGFRAKVQPRFYASWFLGPRSRDSGPGLQTCSRNSAEKLKFFEFIFMPIQSLHFLNIYQKCQVLESQFQFYLVCILWRIETPIF